MPEKGGRKGCHLKSVQPVEEIIRTFTSASSNLLNAISMIGEKIHIERKEVESLMEWIDNPHSENKAACLLGDMGVGKTVVMKDLFLKLQENSIPCLATKADCYTHIKSRKHLSEELGLKDDLLQGIAAVAEEKRKED